MIMRAIHEVSELAGVSIRTLQYYDKIGLLHPAGYTESGYRLYDDTNLEQLQQILLFKELEFPLKDIKEIIHSPNFDKSKALEQQIELLTLKKEHIENLIILAREIKLKGEKAMDFKAFDTRKIDEYTAKAKETWGKTPEYREFEEKSKTLTEDEQKYIFKKLMDIFAEFGKMKEQEPGSQKAQAQVKKLQDFITENFYTCNSKILAELGKFYGSGGEFTSNINSAAGLGSAEFAAAAIEIYCR
jgi:DNA-binding transcriptional MerR regulator